jgi:hypothetical protein
MPDVHLFDKLGRYAGVMSIPADVIEAAAKVSSWMATNQIEDLQGLRHMETYRQRLELEEKTRASGLPVFPDYR